MTRLRCLCVMLLLAGLGLPALARANATGDAQPPSVDRPVVTVGRLLLPWGRNDDSRVLTLALRNDSANAPRQFRVVFFHPDGEVAGTTESRPLPPKGSVVLLVGELIDPGLWQAGSLEVLFRGPGRGRVFGTARQVDLALAQSEVQPLATAGIDVVRGTTDDSPGD